jgi:hypothetical protein
MRIPKPTPPRPILFTGSLCLLATLWFGLSVAAQDFPVKIDPEPAKKKEPERTPAPVVVVPEKKDPPPVIDEAEVLKLNPGKIYLWYAGVEDDAPLRGQTENEDEYRAFNHALAFASKQSLEAMGRQSLKGITFADLFGKVRQDYLRELVRVEGRLARINKVNLREDSFLAQAEKIKHYYEGWVFVKNDIHPVCVVFTELPEGVSVGEHLTWWVTFDGYFLKLMHYESGELKENGRNVWRKAPLLIGRQPVVLSSGPALAGESSDISFISFILGFVLLLLVLGLGFSWWFRREDRAVQEQLSQIRKNPFEDGTRPESAAPER